MLATSQMMATPELLRLVCEHCTQTENYNNALVSKTWSNEALSVLWHELYTLAPLLGLLAPLKDVDDFYYEFHRHIRPSDWATFQKYSWRVHDIKSDAWANDFEASVFVDIASSRPSTDLLPNLRRLTYVDNKPSFRFLPLFIPSSLTYLGLVLMDGEAKLRQAICRDILSYLPEKAANLEHIVLQTDGSTVGVKTANSIKLNVLFAALPSLKEVEISASFFTTSCLRTLAHMQSLKSLTVYENADEAQPAIDITELQFSDTFSSLTCFSIETFSFEGVTSLLDACQPRTLHEIFVTSPGVEDGGAFSGLLAVASSVCLELKKIFVHSVDPEIPTAPQSNLSKEFFSVLYRCTNLTSLTLHNTPPLHLNIETLSDLLKGLPSLRTLRLSEYSGTNPTLPLACLPQLVPLCPQMVELELYMNTSSVPDAKSPHQNDLECFKRLEHLGVGRSPLKSSSLRVTSFLSSILPVGCHLLHDSESSGQRHNTWMSVAEFLPMMIRMRRAERLLDARCDGCRSMK